MRTVKKEKLYGRYPDLPSPHVQIELLENDDKTYKVFIREQEVFGVSRVYFESAHLHEAIQKYNELKEVVTF
ncbi:hypothetical protein KFX46_08160 [Macrococcus canis]|uniref:hypothetical protein n=1 Tax=Macrococcoides canis TaxID=1855823 RepID=UPI00207C86CA|nr:hypothetical protein [Macrococcus canis]MCO4096980.1 hypothetical protein [Macrococcus canis]